MTTNAKKIDAWRKSNPDDRLTAETLREVLDVRNFQGVDFRDVDFRGADFRHSNFQGAGFRGADLRYTDFSDADLRGVNFRHADLRDSDFWGADLRDVDFRGTNFCGTNFWGGLRVDGLESGQVTLVPTSDGWALCVGYWTGTVDALRTMISSNKVWSEACGAECGRRRPQIEALITLCEAHMIMYADLIPSLAERWGTTEEEN